MKKHLFLLLALIILIVPTGARADNSDDEKSLQESLSILEELGCKVNDNLLTQMYKVGESDKKIELNKSSYVILDKNNKIIFINRQEETSELNDNSSNLKDPGKNKDYKKTQDIIEKNLIEDDYELISSDYFDEVTMAYRYEKKLAGGGHDQYDAYNVYIDTSTSELISFQKKGVKSEDYSQTSAPIITEDEALEIANQFLKANNYEIVTDIEMGTAIKDDYFIKLVEGKEVDETPEIIISEDNIQDQDIRNVYIASNSDYEVHVDINTGEIIGGEMTMDAGETAENQDAKSEPGKSNIFMKIWRLIIQTFGLK